MAGCIVTAAWGVPSCGGLGCSGMWAELLLFFSASIVNTAKEIWMDETA